MVIRMISVLMILLLCSCTEARRALKEEKYQPTVKVIDGCEYLEVEYGHTSSIAIYSLTHKGNCSNPIHVCH